MKKIIVIMAILFSTSGLASASEGDGLLMGTASDVEFFALKDGSVSAQIREGSKLHFTLNDKKLDVIDADGKSHFTVTFVPSKYSLEVSKDSRKIYGRITD